MIAPHGQENARAMISFSVSPLSPSSGTSPMIAVCPAGHSSLAQDYCDVCGLPIDSATHAGGGSAAARQRSVSDQDVKPVRTAARTTRSMRCSARTVATTSPREPCPGRWSPRRRQAHSSVSPARRHRPLSPRRLATAPRPPETLDWVAEVWIDPAWYEAQQSPDPMPSPGLPVVVPLRTRVDLGGSYLAESEHPSSDRL